MERCSVYRADMLSADPKPYKVVKALLSCLSFPSWHMRFMRSDSSRAPNGANSAACALGMVLARVLRPVVATSERLLVCTRSSEWQAALISIFSGVQL